MRHLDRFTSAFLVAAFWTTDGTGEEDFLEDTHEFSDIDSDSLDRIIYECVEFQDEAADMIDGRETGAGHDFWLTRNGHGAGFWDGDWPEPDATELTNMSKGWGEMDLYIGDDGVIYVS